MKIKRNDQPQRIVFHPAAAAPVPAEAVPRRGGPLRILGRGLAVLGVVLLTSLGTWGLPQMVQKFYAIRSEKAID